ncbi:DNA (cytosine-5-)-methyltransferase [Bifidobacterium sp. ESL0690]|uniref:DNA cytosine methyltransferase n=1 Tax=Bifidobacterium sp. ESL0690 TaxID=2983214 RepID=UPI0023F8CCCC|nr:DNA (cytosine-5-)-methyltransferase [Bifidobacterium sp. ESL0690]WEV47282.1 DNA (cytosine-5-)-methyltransferase [Bifidobacterium sp. ESL0690]
MSHSVVDLFAGCGGMSTGFSQAGFGVIAAFEVWDAAINCYNDNFPDHNATKADLSNVPATVAIIRPLKPEIIVGGPPCQDFSNAGLRKEGNRAALTESFAEIVCAVKPGFFVMENVARARTSHSYSLARNLFKTAGYGLTELVLDANYFGVPQHRKRFVVIGSQKQTDNFLNSNLLSQETLLPLTVREKYPDFPVDFYYRHPRSYSRRAIFTIDEPAPTIRGVNRPKPPTYKPHKNDKSLSKNITALSYKQRALLQTFPNDYIWSGTNTEKEQMIGNAVPVEFARRIASALMSFINKQEPQKSFISWLQSGMTNESAKDVLSHLRYADRILPFVEDDFNAEDYNKQLEKCFKRTKLSSTNQQKIRRAINLFSNYQLGIDFIRLSR